MTGKLTWDEAGAQLDLSGRQVGRLCGKVLKNGNAGIIHGLRGKPSNNKLEPGLLEEAMGFVKSKYSDFGPTFANEKLFKIQSYPSRKSASFCLFTVPKWAVCQ